MINDKGNLCAKAIDGDSAMEENCPRLTVEEYLGMAMDRILGICGFIGWLVCFSLFVFAASAIIYGYITSMGMGGSPEMDPWIVVSTIGAMLSAYFLANVLSLFRVWYIEVALILLVALGVIMTVFDVVKLPEGMVW